MWSFLVEASRSLSLLYCLVHVFYVVRFCDYVWSFRMEANECIFIFCLFVYICIAIGDPFIKKGHVVVHFCNSVWSFRAEANKCRLFIVCLFISVVLLDTRLLRRGSGWNFIN